MHDGDYRAPERISFGDYLVERWLPTKQSQLRPSTYASYKNNVEVHINPRRELSPTHWRRAPRRWMQPQQRAQSVGRIPTETTIGMQHCMRCEAALGHRDPVSRPSEGVKVEVRVPMEVLAQVDRRAAKSGLTRAATLRSLIEAGLAT